MAKTPSYRACAASLCLALPFLAGCEIAGPTPEEKAEVLRTVDDCVNTENAPAKIQTSIAKGVKITWAGVASVIEHGEFKADVLQTTIQLSDTSVGGEPYSGKATVATHLHKDYQSGGTRPGWWAHEGAVGYSERATEKRPASLREINDRLWARYYGMPKTDRGCIESPDQILKSGCLVKAGWEPQEDREFAWNLRYTPYFYLWGRNHDWSINQHPPHSDFPIGVGTPEAKGINEGSCLTETKADSCVSDFFSGRIDPVSEKISGTTVTTSYSTHLFPLAVHRPLRDLAKKVAQCHLKAVEKIANPRLGS